ncbi:hypothetical protein IEI94_12090 [Halomonas sp. ML-15]|uniref:hypothetical protein n=1 Tax=Halomonas sp. ML-15 TaxID=2773305 RepID=UPI0017475FF3|nr:hypothetical protein [Halomonas sp. ML-15]MBD3896591.1 hypothetical protein [Halomonas sp. ML-15]
MSYHIEFANQRTTDGCTFVDVFARLPYQQLTITPDGQRPITLPGEDVSIICGSDVLGWDITFGPRITADLIDGLEIPGVTLGINRVDSTIHGSGLIYARDFSTLEAAKTFVRYLYKRFYDAFYRVDTYDAEPSDPTDNAADAVSESALEEECWLCDGCGEVETFKPDGSPITVGCPACVQRDRDAIIERLRTKLYVVLTVSPRSVPAPLTHDGAAHRIAFCSTPEWVTFYPPAMDAPPATGIHTYPRNTQ